MTLDFSRLGWNATFTMVIFEPAAGFEDFGVLAPDGCRKVDRRHGDTEESSLGNRHVLHQLTGFQADRFREGNHVIFECLSIRREMVGNEKAEIGDNSVLCVWLHGQVRAYGELRERRHRDMEDHLQVDRTSDPNRVRGAPFAISSACQGFARAQ